MIEPGLYRMPEEKHHAVEAFSKSGASKILRSPAHYKVEKKQTNAMVVGTAAHRATFERDRFESMYICKPESMKFSTKDGKTWQEANNDKIILPYNDYENVTAISKAVWSNEDAAFLLSSGEAEVSGFFYLPEFPDVLCKMRIDWLNKGTGFLVDLKKCQDARKHAFERDAYKFGYHLQAALYTRGMEILTGISGYPFYFVAVEEDPPHGIMVYMASENMIDRGRKEIYEAIEIYQDCIEANSWPGYESGIVDLDVPTWVWNKNETMVFYG